jgi:hypothetical protein
MQAVFDRVCGQQGIEHRLTKPYHPCINGQAERMNRTIKDATTKTFHHPDVDALKTHVPAFVTAHNFAKHLKTLRWRTPVQTVCGAWAKHPTTFRISPHHPIPGTYDVHTRESATSQVVQHLRSSRLHSHLIGSLPYRHANQENQSVSSSARHGHALSIRATVDVSKPAEVIGWCNKWRVTPEQLKAAVADVGISALDVAKALGKSH